MNIGDVVTMDACKLNYGKDSEVRWVSYKAPPGEHFVFLLLGSQPKDGPALDADQVLIDHGWSPPDPAEPPPIGLEPALATVPLTVQDTQESLPESPQS